MTKRANEIKHYILYNVTDHPKYITRVTAGHFGTSRQAVARHIRALVRGGLLSFEGNTKAREYKLKKGLDKFFHFSVSPDLKEDVVWRNDIYPLLKHLEKNVLDICQFGFTEMLNNVIDHSESKDVSVALILTPIDVSFNIFDKGIGIFSKIQKDFNLSDPRHALLELSKGKLTSSPKRHTGQGIFFTSRMFNLFEILSGTLYYSAEIDGDNWLLEVSDEIKDKEGTYIKMSINYNSQLTVNSVFDKFSPESAGYAFTKTHVPIMLAKYEGEQMVSRSQAKRVLTRFEDFKEVMLDFQGIASIGQAFADEIFRVYKIDHPNVSIIYIGATEEVAKTIEQVQSISTPL